MESKARATRGIFINSDAWNFWASGKAEMGEEDIRGDVDFYVAGGGVEALLYNMNFQRTFFDSKVWTPYWKDLEISGDGGLLLRGRPVPARKGAPGGGSEKYLAMFRAVASMRRNCPDYMRVRYGYCRRRGVEMWHSMRVNDVHWTQPGCEERPQHGDFWRDRRETATRAWYRRGWFPEWHWENYALDFGRPDVMAYSLALVAEYLLDYESDGIEIDWLRSVPVLRPGFDEAGVPLLTGFMREVRRLAGQAAAKWGHRVRVGVRCPSHVQDALDLGLDVRGWAEEGLVDVVSPGPKSVRTEQDCQVALWRAILPRGVVLAPAIDMYVSSGGMARNDLWTDAGFASNYYGQGADTIYCYNHFPLFQRSDAPDARYADMRDFFPLAADRARCAAAPRRHVVTWRETIVEGARAESPFPASIPAGSAGALRVNLGEGTAGRAAALVLGMTRPASFEVWINGERRGDVEISPAAGCGPSAEAFGRELRVGRSGGASDLYAVLPLPAGAVHDGWNVIDLANTGGEALSERDFLWAEVVVGAGDE